MFQKWLKEGIQRPFGTTLAYEISVGAVIFRRDSEGRRHYLLLRYPYGYWDYVKGHVEAGESHPETLARETREEAGIELTHIYRGFHERSWYRYTAKSQELAKRQASGKGTRIYKVVHFYLAETTTEALQLSEEHIDGEWLDYTVALERLVFPRSKDILRKAEAFLAHMKK
jgi:8-oxo-dGTP pyrophosphatase MutT (NUDIX family)